MARVPQNTMFDAVLAMSSSVSRGAAFFCCCFLFEAPPAVGAGPPGEPAPTPAADEAVLVDDTMAAAGAQAVPPWTAPPDGVFAELPLPDCAKESISRKPATNSKRRSTKQTMICHRKRAARRCSRLWEAPGVRVAGIGEAAHRDGNELRVGTRLPAQLTVDWHAFHADKSKPTSASLGRGSVVESECERARAPPAGGLACFACFPCPRQL